MEKEKPQSFTIQGVKFTFKEVDGHAIISYQPAPKDDAKPRIGGKQAQFGNDIIEKLAVKIAGSEISEAVVEQHEGTPPVKYLTTPVEDMSQFNQVVDVYHEFMESKNPQQRWLKLGKDEGIPATVSVEFDNTDKQNCKVTLTMPDVSKDVVYPGAPKEKNHPTGSEWFTDTYTEACIVVDQKKAHGAQFSHERRDATYPVLGEIASALRSERKKVTTWPTSDKPAQVSFNVPYEKLPNAMKELQETLEGISAVPTRKRG